MKVLSLKLWLFFCVNVFLLILCQYLGIFDTLAAVDFTYLSFVIIGIMMVDMLYLTITIWKGESPDLENHWAIKDILLAMGLTGTLIGLIYVFAPLGGVDMSNATSVQQMIGHITYGLGTKLWTSLAGIICSNILMVFLLIIQTYQKNNETQ